MLNFYYGMFITSYPKVGGVCEGLMDKEVCINTAEGRFWGCVCRSYLEG